MLSVIEVQAQETLRPVGQFDRSMEARQDRVKAPSLERRGACQLGPADPRAKTEIVLDARAGARLAAGRPSLGDERS